MRRARAAYGPSSRSEPARVRAAYPHQTGLTARDVTPLDSEGSNARRVSECKKYIFTAIEDDNRVCNQKLWPAFGALNQDTERVPLASAK